MNNYHGYTYSQLLDNRIAHFLWRLLFCRAGWHLWDEYQTVQNHFLFCDACDEKVTIIP